MKPGGSGTKYDYGSNPRSSEICNDQHIRLCYSRLEHLPLKQAEVITLSAVIALRASQQAHSHCKAVLQLGNSPQPLRTLDNVAQDLAERSQTPLPEKPVVTNLEEELSGEL
jgi:hypothetical protein